ncbi:hypothetical protein [Alienimonas californiensis]|uniref:Uncharacterized protein n=1 Tax=Alienimonas californiensis TaxID=2527989 RepID=A0A517PAR7_9PLAN|nr:hypothetical protein [Alienimonas californiensis]QDT16470.1 hypothetical protein CA12_25740 [Alienimonas californiensis]
MSPEPWQWLFFAALGAWLAAGAVRPAAERPHESGLGRWCLALVGTTLLVSAVAATWGDLPR